MLLNITGSEGLVAPDLIDAFVRYVVRKFVKNTRTYNSITVNLNFTNTVMRRERWGEAMISDDRPKPRTFTVNVAQSGIPFLGILITLAHELMHVKQWVLGELITYLRPNCYRWMGNKMTTSGSKIEYLESPWELEARAWEKALVEGFHIQNNIMDAEWLNDAIL